MISCKRRQNILIALLGILVACSYEASKLLVVNYEERSAGQVVEVMQKIGRLMNYESGHFYAKNEIPVTVLEQECCYRLYFLNKPKRTSFSFNVDKQLSRVKIKFSEFGVQELSVAGNKEYTLLLSNLVSEFGAGAVEVAE